MRSDMMELKTQVPGSQTDKKKNNQYQQAIASEEKGDGEFDSKDFNAALFSFENAKRLYAEASLPCLQAACRRRTTDVRAAPTAGHVPI